MSKFVRPFGKEIQTASHLRAAGCAKCGKYGYAALRVALRLDLAKPAETVFWKKQCVFCGEIARYCVPGAENGAPLFYMPYSTGRGFSVKFRDFYLPPELYTTADGKADVGLKVRLLAQIARLAEQNPKRSEFSWAEINSSLDKV